MRTGAERSGAVMRAAFHARSRLAAREPGAPRPAQRRRRRDPRARARRAHTQLGTLARFSGEAPDLDDLMAHVRRRLNLVPRFRQKLATPPLSLGRPRWVDDPRFNLGYHVRHTALPEPGTEHELRALVGRLFAQKLDRTKPLWELWMVEGLGDGGFALVSKTHARARRRRLRGRPRDDAVRPRPGRVRHAGDPALDAAARPEHGAAHRPRAERRRARPHAAHRWARSRAARPRAWASSCARGSARHPTRR